MHDDTDAAAADLPGGGFLSAADREYLLYGGEDLDPAERRRRERRVRDRTVDAFVDFTYLAHLDSAGRDAVFEELYEVLDDESFPSFDNHGERIAISPPIYLGVLHVLDFLYTSLGFSRFRKLLQVSVFQSIFWEARRRFERVHPVRPEDVQFDIAVDEEQFAAVKELFG